LSNGQQLSVLSSYKFQFLLDVLGSPSRGGVATDARVDARGNVYGRAEDGF
jgi:hypothetical protein